MTPSLTFSKSEAAQFCSQAVHLLPTYLDGYPPICRCFGETEGCQALEVSPDGAEAYAMSVVT